MCHKNKVFAYISVLNNGFYFYRKFRQIMFSLFYLVIIFEHLNEVLLRWMRYK